MTCSTCPMAGIDRFIPDTLKTMDLTRELSREHTSREDIDDPFFIVDVGNIIEKLKIWRKLLPNVEPFYAIKCNSEPAVLELMVRLGIGFDCASKKEISTMLDLGVHPSKIIFANPCKQKSHLRYAEKRDLYFMTFDNEAELDKVKETCPRERLVLRILTDDSTAQCQLGLKYGCHPKRARYLLDKAKNLGLEVIGVSFHVGSGCRDALAYSKAISSARDVMDMGTEIGFDMKVLDIGGGFPGQDSVQLKFEEVATVIKESLEKYFPPEANVRVIAEPGRYFVASAFTLVVNVTAKRMVARDCQTFKVPQSEGLVANSEAPTKCDEPGYMYYVNDGVYGSFNCLLYDHATVFPQLLEKRDAEEPRFSSSIWGPSCDGLDRIIENTLLPVLDVGEWIVFSDMGAYTISAGSEFNGFKKPHCFYVCRESMKSELLKAPPVKSGKSLVSPVVVDQLPLYPADNKTLKSKSPFHLKAPHAMRINPMLH